MTTKEEKAQFRGYDKTEYKQKEEKQRMMTNYRLIVTEGVWYSLIESGKKKFDFRKGIREINVGDVVTFMEADSTRVLTGKTCTFEVTLVVYSTDFPKHFNWNGGEFTIIQFADLKEKE